MSSETEAYEDGYDQGHADAHADGAAEDRGATVPEAHIPLHDVARAIVRHRLNDPLTPAALDALAWAVTRTPEGRDKVLAALVETGTLTDRWRWHQRGATGPERPVRRWVNEASGDTIEHRLVTEWTEVEP